MTDETTEQEKLLETNPDFILLRRFDFSLKQALKRYPDGLPDNLVAQALGKSPTWVAERYEGIVEKLREQVVPERREQ